MRVLRCARSDTVNGVPDACRRQEAPSSALSPRDRIERCGATPGAETASVAHGQPPQAPLGSRRHNVADGDR